VIFRAFSFHDREGNAAPNATVADADGIQLEVSGRHVQAWLVVLHLPSFFLFNYLSLMTVTD